MDTFMTIVTHPILQVAFGSALSLIAILLAVFFIIVLFGGVTQPDTPQDFLVASLICIVSIFLTIVCGLVAWHLVSDVTVWKHAVGMAT